MSQRPDTAEAESLAPETLEGWYVLHDGYTLDWAKWRSMPGAERALLIDELAAWTATAGTVEQGQSACYQMLGQKSDLLWLHYRSSPAELGAVERGLRSCGVFDYLVPSFSYLSVIEASLYEATAIAHGMLARKGITPGKEGFDAAFEAELEVQRAALNQRVFRDIPAQNHICIYPMNKRRGEHVNWYDLSIDERRKLMRGHGKLGRKYVPAVTQVISGSVGLDDWEWMVDLHSDDPLLFKKLVYEMRFDPASSRYAEFGAFLVGLKLDDNALRQYLAL
ncbi:MAG: heme-dependent peroxidase [Planctomycetota bacterium]|jgi:peroxiredoxin|nr:heme-dependent peroxidase [Planctomycetota bacterium]